MGSSFEDLVETNPTVKTDRESGERFELQNILNTKFLKESGRRQHFCFYLYACNFFNGEPLSYARAVAELSLRQD